MQTSNEATSFKLFNQVAYVTIQALHPRTVDWISNPNIGIS